MWQMYYVGIFLCRKLQFGTFNKCVLCFFYSLKVFPHNDALPRVALCLSPTGPVMLPYGSDIITEPGGP